MKRCNLKIISCGSCRHPELMTRKNASLFPADFPSLVGIIEHPDQGLILFDTGYDQAFFEATQTFPERFYRWTTPVTIEEGETALSQIQKLGYKAEDVTKIIISHFHGDHISGLHHFPNAQIICSKVGLRSACKGSRFKQVRKGILSSLIPANLSNRASFFEDGTCVTLPKNFEPFANSVDILKDGSLLAVELPGHCPGHWGLAIRTQNDEFVFLVADAAWSISAIAENSPPPNITINLLGFTKDYYKTLQELNLLYKSGREVIIIPSHCRLFAKGIGGSTYDPSI